VQELVESRRLDGNVKVPTRWMWPDDGADGVLQQGLSGDYRRSRVRAFTPWRAVVAETAPEVVVGNASHAERLHGWLNERGAAHVTV
jgi:hypothetical protein